MIYSNSSATASLVHALQELQAIEEARRTAQTFYGTLPLHMEERQTDALLSLRDVLRYLLQELEEPKPS